RVAYARHDAQLVVRAAVPGAHQQLLDAVVGEVGEPHHHQLQVAGHLDGVDGRRGLDVVEDVDGAVVGRRQLLPARDAARRVQRRNRDVPAEIEAGPIGGGGAELALAVAATDLHLRVRHHGHVGLGVAVEVADLHCLAGGQADGGVGGQVEAAAHL